jgi:hypothetical protein
MGCCGHKLRILWIQMSGGLSNFEQQEDGMVSNDKTEASCWRKIHADAGRKKGRGSPAEEYAPEALGVLYGLG